jgi:hypothetical protein
MAASRYGLSRLVVQSVTLPLPPALPWPVARAGWVRVSWSDPTSTLWDMPQTAMLPGTGGGVRLETMVYHHTAATPTAGSRATTSAPVAGDTPTGGSTLHLLLPVNYDTSLRSLIARLCGAIPAPTLAGTTTPQLPAADQVATAAPRGMQRLYAVLFVTGVLAFRERAPAGGAAMAGTAQLLDDAGDHANRSLFGMRARNGGPASWQHRTVDAWLPPDACCPYVGAVHVPALLDVSAARDTGAAPDALELVTSRGVLTLTAEEASTCTQWLDSLQHVLLTPSQSALAAADAVPAAAADAELLSAPHDIAAPISADRTVAAVATGATNANHALQLKQALRLQGAGLAAAVHMQGSASAAVTPILPDAAPPEGSVCLLSGWADKRGRINRGFQRRGLRLLLTASQLAAVATRPAARPARRLYPMAEEGEPTTGDEVGDAPDAPDEPTTSDGTASRGTGGEGGQRGRGRASSVAPSSALSIAADDTATSGKVYGAVRAWAAVCMDAVALGYVDAFLARHAMLTQPYVAVAAVDLLHAAVAAAVHADRRQVWAPYARAAGTGEPALVRSLWWPPSTSGAGAGQALGASPTAASVTYSVTLAYFRPPTSSRRLLRGLSSRRLNTNGSAPAAEGDGDDQQRGAVQLVEAGVSRVVDSAPVPLRLATPSPAAHGQPEGIAVVPSANPRQPVASVIVPAALSESPGGAAGAAAQADAAARSGGAGSRNSIWRFRRPTSVGGAGHSSPALEVTTDEAVATPAASVTGVSSSARRPASVASGPASPGGGPAAAGYEFVLVTRSPDRVWQFRVDDALVGTQWLLYLRLFQQRRLHRLANLLAALPAQAPAVESAVPVFAPPLSAMCITHEAAATATATSAAGMGYVAARAEVPISNGEDE